MGDCLCAVGIIVKVHTSWVREVDGMYTVFKCVCTQNVKLSTIHTYKCAYMHTSVQFFCMTVWLKAFCHWLNSLKGIWLISQIIESSWQLSCPNCLYTTLIGSLAGMSFISHVIICRLVVKNIKNELDSPCLLCKRKLNLDHKVVNKEHN